VEAYDAIPYNAAIMTRRGVIVSINSDDAEEATHLNQEAAKTMKYGGLTHDESLKLVTLNPAIQLGIDKRVGSIDVGKDADLVIYNHDPLSAYAVVQQTLIDGRVYFDRKRDITDRANLEKEKKALMQKEKSETPERPLSRTARLARQSAGHGRIALHQRRRLGCRNGQHHADADREIE
jgi:adenine deaminase